MAHPAANPGNSAGAAEKPRESADAPARVRVLLPLPLGEPYDYALPEGWVAEPGAVVEVPLGSRRVPGVIWDVAPEDAKVPAEKLKRIIRRFDIPPLPETARRFVEWVAAYYLAPAGAVLKMSLSVAAALDPPRPSVGYRLAERTPEDAGLRMTSARKRVLEVLADGPPRMSAELADEAGVSPAVIKGLADGGVLEAVPMSLASRFEEPNLAAPGPTLANEQGIATRGLRSKVRDGAFSVSLLDGVTGSGKTEVYLEAAREALTLGRQVLVLLPEIALSAQWLDRFEQRFGVAPAQWHSDLTPAQRRSTWRAVAHGEARVVVGARSALFLPYPDLGLIVVDEEHDPAFKQEDGVPYNARDMAVVRARLQEIPCVLVSATPSLESVENVRAGRYDSFHLSQRHAGAALPEIVTADLRADPPPRIPGHGQSFLSTALREAISATLAAEEQVMLFLNRRGYAPLTLCRHCGHRMQCPNCTAWLVEHRLVDRLQCHHCGFTTAPPESCPECGAAGSLAACGPGVERLSEEVRLLFPKARMTVMASDTITGPSSAARFVESVRDREVDLLIGTQIVAKGHHFPHLTLVGVVDADLGLTGGDLRASERTYQLLHQVAGRAGRAAHPGRVILQTYDPEQSVMQALVSGERDRFLEAEAEDRRAAGMPPFARLVAIVVSAPEEAVVEDLSRALARAAPTGEGIEVLGPAPAPMAILRGRHRRRLLLKTRRDIAPQPLLRRWLRGVDVPGKARLDVDVDPYSFL